MQRVPSPTTRDLPSDTPGIATRSAPRVLSGPPPPDRRVEVSALSTRLLNRHVGSPRALVAALVVLALLPNLTVAAFVWLPALWTDPPEAKVESPAHRDATGIPDTPPKETAKLALALTVPSSLEANAGEDVALPIRSEEHTSELQSLTNLVCRLLLEKKKTKQTTETRDDP